MDAEIRHALRAMSLPGALETIPTEALLNIARECLGRADAPEALQDALLDVIPRLLPEKGVYELTAEERLAHVFAKLPENILDKLAGLCNNVRWDINRRRVARETEAAAAKHQASKIASFTIPQDPSFDWNPLTRRLRTVSEEAFLEMSTPEPRALAIPSLRAWLRRRFPGLKVRVEGPKTYVFKPKEE